MEEIDLTPEGLKTQEGIRRVNKATEAIHDANARCAELLPELIEDYVEGYSGGQGPFQDIVPIVRAALAARRAAAEEFARAICGRPPHA